MSTPWVPIINQIVDGDTVSAEVLQPVLDSYTARTQFLYDEILALEDKSTLIAFDQPVGTLDGVAAFSVAYFDPVDGRLKLAKPSIEFSDGITQLKAANPAYVFGIVKSISSGKATVWLEGLVVSTGILAAVLDSSELNEGISGGPLYLSGVDAGKLTFVPGGFAIYVGYAKNANEILLNPTFDALNNFFIDYRYPILDRPAGVPQLTGSTWSISSPDVTKVGWVPADGISSPTPPSIPSFTAGSYFFYNLPADSDIDNDAGLSPHEKSVSKKLRKAFPPNPSGFTLLFLNGELQSLRELGVEDNTTSTTTPATTTTSTTTHATSSTTTTSTTTHTTSSTTSTTTPAPPWDLEDGIYFVNDDGLWWYRRDTHKQPWSDDLVSGNGGSWGTNDWKTWKGSSNLRPRMLLIFTKLNPAYAQGLVTSLRPYKDNTNDSTRAVQFLDTEDPTIEAATGDLLLKYKLPINTPTDEPAALGTAVKALEYDEITGGLNVVQGPIVRAIQGTGGIKVTPDLTTGNYLVSLAPYAIPTLVSTIEPENSRLELIGLNTCLTFDYANLPCGFLGKILLPNDIPNLPMQISLIIIGKSAVISGKNTVELSFQYNVMAPNTVLNTSSTTRTFNYVFGSSYVANTNLIISPAELKIAASELVANGIINFRFQRPKAVLGNAYNQGFSVVAAYWSLG